jgi:hypothetical protein
MRVSNIAKVTLKSIYLMRKSIASLKYFYLSLEEYTYEYLIDRLLIKGLV